MMKLQYPRSSVFDWYYVIVNLTESAIIQELYNNNISTALEYIETHCDLHLVGLIPCSQQIIKKYAIICHIYDEIIGQMPVKESSAIELLECYNGD